MGESELTGWVEGLSVSVEGWQHGEPEGVADAMHRVQGLLDAVGPGTILFSVQNTGTAFDLGLPMEIYPHGVFIGSGSVFACAAFSELDEDTLGELENQDRWFYVTCSPQDVKDVLAQAVAEIGPMTGEAEREFHQRQSDAFVQILARQGVVVTSGDWRTELTFHCRGTDELGRVSEAMRSFGGRIRRRSGSSPPSEP